MIKQLFTRYLPALCLLLPLLLTGCIKEDYSDCPTGLKVFFTYEPATYARMGVDPTEVDRLDLFVFDAQGIYRGVWIDENPELSPEYYMSLPNLPEGDYTFIAWDGNHNGYSFGCTFEVGQTTLSEATLVLDHVSGQIEAGLHPLFHAYKVERVHNTRDQRVYVPLVQLYNTINLTTEGLSDNGDTYRITIYDNNGTYKFDNSFVPDDDFIYTTLCTKDNAGQLLASLNVLKLAADRHPVLEITNVTKGITLYSEDLVKLINAIGNINYNTTHTFDIHLKLGVDAKVSVRINGWWVVVDGGIILM